MRSVWKRKSGPGRAVWGAPNLSRCTRRAFGKQVRHRAAPTSQSVLIFSRRVHRRAFLWTPTTAARDRRDPWIIEVVSDVNLRDQFDLQDCDVVEIKVPTSRVQK